jgi:serine protease
MRSAGVVAMVLVLAFPCAGWAAAPGSGAVSPQSTQTQWTGEVAGPGGVAHAAAGGLGGACPPPGCDSFTLDLVTDGSLPLTVEAEASTPAQEISIEVVMPGGETAFQGGVSPTQTQRTLTIPAAPAGRYAINISGGSLPTAGPATMSYLATATLGTDSLSCRMLRPFPYETGGEPRSGAPANDPLYPLQHGHRLMNVAAAWARGGRGQGVTIAILDTGVDLNHPDLADRLVPGVDIVEGKGSDCAPGPQDGHGHGTHVAGLAAATAGNGIGVAGVAPEAQIMPVRVCSTGYCEDISRAIVWATDHGADVINMSLGTSEVDLLLAAAPLADLESDAAAVRYAADHGVIVVASAGNESWAFCGHPAADPGALCAAAVDRDGRPTTYSNLPFDRDGKADAFRAFGGDGDGCDTLAISTGWPGAGINACGAAYQGLAGTSMASPHLAGAAAVLLSLGLTPEKVVERLKATASNGGSYDPVMGYGIPDLDAATVSSGRRAGTGACGSRGRPRGRRAARSGRSAAPSRSRCRSRRPRPSYAPRRTPGR